MCDYRIYNITVYGKNKEDLEKISSILKGEDPDRKLYKVISMDCDIQDTELFGPDLVYEFRGKMKTRGSISFLHKVFSKKKKEEMKNYISLRDICKEFNVRIDAYVLSRDKESIEIFEFNSEGRLVRDYLLDFDLFEDEEEEQV